MEPRPDSYLFLSLSAAPPGLLDGLARIVPSPFRSPRSVASPEDRSSGPLDSASGSPPADGWRYSARGCSPRGRPTQCLRSPTIHATTKVMTALIMSKTPINAITIEPIALIAEPRVLPEAFWAVEAPQMNRISPPTTHTPSGQEPNRGAIRCNKRVVAKITALIAPSIKRGITGGSFRSRIAPKTKRTQTISSRPFRNDLIFWLSGCRISVPQEVELRNAQNTGKK